MISEYDAARERGRLMAARKLAVDHEKRKQMEADFGVSVLRANYPEAYAAGSESLFEKVRKACRFPENP